MTKRTQAAAAHHQTRRTRRQAITSLLAIGAVAVMACWPVTTRSGVNYVWSAKRITLFEKVVDFVSRDLQARRLTREVTAGAPGDDAKLSRIFAWVSEHVKPVPAGFPIVDDHVLNILIRGYGAPDQRTEAFTLLASYAGYPSTMLMLRAPDAPGSLPVALVRCNGRLVMFDVVNRVVVRNAKGELAGVEELAADPRYARYVSRLRLDRVSFARMEDQRPWPRLWRMLRSIGNPGHQP